MSNERALAPVDSNVFLAFDRLDDNQIVQEMKGAALQEYVYEFTSGNKPVRGLSKAGTDDAARIMAVQYGEVLREEDCWMETQDDEAAYFKARVSRYVIRKDGTEMRMDSAVGHKRQPKKDRYGKSNEFWYEQGGQKALRNAKQKLIPEAIKQAIIASYVEQGKVRRVRAEEVSERPAPPRPAPEAVVQNFTGTQLSLPNQVKEIYRLARETWDMTEDAIEQRCIAKYGNMPDKLTQTQAAEIIEALKAKPKDKKGAS